MLEELLYVDQEEIIDLAKRAEADKMWRRFLDDNKSGKIIIYFKNGKCFHIEETRSIYYPDKNE